MPMKALYRAWKVREGEWKVVRRNGDNPPGTYPTRREAREAARRIEDEEHARVRRHNDEVIERWRREKAGAD